MTQALLILGASARAAAFSAVRAGFAPTAGDMFADADLRGCCPAEQIAPYPDRLTAFAFEQSPSRWMYTGALENEPALVDEISTRHMLLGNPGRVLREVRDPWQVAAALRQAGLSVPRLANRLAERTPDDVWLSKPVDSCGGGGIRAVDRHDAPKLANSPLPGRYLQQFIDGIACGAVYVAADGDARLLGVTRQLVGRPWTGADRYQYAGATGPLSLTSPQREQFRRLGECLAACFGLVGLFGVDAVIRDETVWPIEVNPRYTASIEILERALSIDTIRLHATACTEKSLPHDMPQQRQPTRRHGKAILYAPEDMFVNPELTDYLQGRNEAQWPEAADIPTPGTRILAGQPITTVFAEATSEEDIETKLAETASTIFGILNSHCKRKNRG